MEAFDGLVTFFPDSKYLLNESVRADYHFLGWDWDVPFNYYLVLQSKLERLPTTDSIIWGTTVTPNDGLGIQPYPSVLNLYAGGCKTWNNDINCTEACGDIKLFFQDWQTQWNCLTLANMAMSKPHPHSYSNSENTGDTAKALNHLAVPNLTAFDAFGARKRFHNCAGESWPKDVAFIDFHTFTNSSNSSHVLQWGDYMSQVCNYRNETHVDNDLAGPGVIVSYIMLICIVSYAWICIRILQIASSIDWFVSLTRFKGRIYSLITFQRSRVAMRIKHSAGVLAVELQEAQCFFIFAIQVGLIYANSRPTEYFGTHNWRQVLYSRATMHHLTLIASLPLLMNQINLRKLQLDCIYSLSLCTVVFIMSYIASVSPLLGGLEIDTIYRMSMSADNEKCGGFVRMADLCAPVYDSLTVDHDVQVIIERILMKMCCTTLCILWSKKLWTEFGGTLWLKKYAWAASKKGPWMLICAVQLGRLLTTMFLVSWEICFTYYMLTYSPYLYDAWDDTYDSEIKWWPIGQVISMLVWAPVISKHIYTLIFGVERAFAIRISEAFAIIRKPTQPIGQVNPTDQSEQEDQIEQSDSPAPEAITAETRT